jgi:hypothetical protein
MDDRNTRLGLLAASLGIVALAGLDLLGRQPDLAGQDLLLLAAGALPVAALAVACMLPDAA